MNRLFYLFLFSIVLVHGFSNAHMWHDGKQFVDAKWIEKNYGKECCGEEDCKPVPVSDVLLTAAGYTVNGLVGFLPKKKVKKSPDGQWWACGLWGHGEVDDGLGDEVGDENDWGVPHLNCLFRPQMLFF